MKKIFTVCAGLILGAGAPAAWAQDVVIGVPNWPSVNVTAHVLQRVIEDNLGLEVELQPGTNPIVFEAMDSGSMHVHPEVWLPNQSNLHDTFVKDKGTVRMNPNGVIAFQGMCVTKDTPGLTGIKSLSDLSDPDMAAKFDKDGDGKGNVWIGAPGWASTNVEKIRARSYGYSETMNLDEIDETLALAEVDNAVAKGEPIVFFCYSPHHMFALHELVVLEEPAHDESKWVALQPTDDPEWLEKSNAGMAWKDAMLHIHYSSSLEESHPLVASILANASFDSDTISRMTFAVVVEKQDPEEFARNWVAENSSLVNSWLR